MTTPAEQLQIQRMYDLQIRGAKSKDQVVQEDLEKAKKKIKRMKREARANT